MGVGMEREWAWLFSAKVLEFARAFGEERRGELLLFSALLAEVPFGFASRGVGDHGLVGK